ncbi:MAG: single-stranded-DNA-specific exonuclease RecJ [Lachnospiraceae bacterium]|nr:single-stranded-DNA-specific exonuclease RecJ [Lachnospiraceae bacterium]
MKEKWVLTRKGADYEGLANALGVDPVIVRILVNRGMKTEEEMRTYLYGGKEALHDPHLLKDIDLASEIISEKISAGKKIRIIGDYDIDGVMGSYILLQGFARCGAVTDAAIPDRIKDGYGINEALILQAKEDAVDTIVTCDNGISAIEPIALAKSLGMTVVVTDHHEVPFDVVDGQRMERKPGADAIVNPKQEEDHYPFPGLCGGAVAMKLIQVLYEKCGIPASEAEEFYQYAGFATIGDVMDLQGENRLLAKLGLEALNHTENLGLRALIAQNDLEDAELKAYHVGFRIGPCLNASGRLETAQLSLKLLQSSETKDAVPMAIEVTNLNLQRKEMTEAAVLQAIRSIEENGYGTQRVLVVYLPDCHESLAGIVAGRLRERYHRPSLVITQGEAGAKGSGRSIEQYSMFEELNRHGELFTKYGGHPMAAGFSLPEENISLLRTALNESCSLTEADLIPKVRIDVDMPMSYVSTALIDQLSMLEPFGKANEKPVFAQRNVEIRSCRIIGKNRNVLRMTLRPAPGYEVEAIYFGDPEDLFSAIEEKYDKITADAMRQGRYRDGVKLHFCYYPELNTWRGETKLQMQIISVSA